jgi:glycine cleavage system aminomethyltransferase T/glycine/D-amino acid oxidase-like deaminating enzyme
MEQEARVVIVGAGIVGCSTAYHLTQLGWDNIVVLEQGPLFHTGGSTSHAPGLVFQTNSSKTMTRFAMYTVELLKQFDLDGEPCYNEVGGIEVAHTEARWEDLKRKLGWAKAWGLQAELVSPAEVKEMVPLIDPSQIYGGYYVPTDGDARAVAAAEVLAREAEAKGARFYGHTPVVDIELSADRVQAVVTPRGRVETELVLACANIWGPIVGEMVGVPIPLSPVEHQYVITEPLAGLAGETRAIVHPILRHQDRSMYFRQHADRYGIGSYQHEPLLVDPEDIANSGAPLSPPEGAEPGAGPGSLWPADAGVLGHAVRDFTPSHFMPAWESAVQLLPSLRGAALSESINGMFSFTPDGMPIMGESATVGGFWSAQAIWVTHAGGAGKAIAEWMVDGTPSLDLRDCDIRRFQPHATTRSYVRRRAAQQYREVYDIIHPKQQLENPRGLRVSPFHDRLENLGGVFFESGGWERAQWFESNAGLLDKYHVPERSGWEAMYWSPIEGAEHQATRDGVAMFDVTNFAKFTVSGPDALDGLQYLAANNLDRPVGTVVYTSMLNSNGGIVTDLTVTRLGPDDFLILTGGGVRLRDLTWIGDALAALGDLPGDADAAIADISSAYCGIGVWGPRARDLLQPISEDDLSDAAFPYFTAREIAVGPVPALALRVSYVGELGWEIYTPTEYGSKLWDILWQAGEPLGVIAAGGGAFDSLRLEKGYRLWGADIHTEYNPYEAGLGFAVQLNKGDFIGRDALRGIQEQAGGQLDRQLCCMTLDDPGAVVMGKEPILAPSDSSGHGGDQVLGYVTSAAYGYSIGRGIVYGYLPVAHATPGTGVEVEYFGRRYPATVAAEPLYDPQNAKLRG